METALWDVVTGGSGGLTPGAVYYLSTTTAGHMTTILPSTADDFIVVCGKAMNATTFIVQIGNPPNQVSG